MSASIDPDVLCILQMVASDFRITVEHLLGRNRARRYSYPRMLAIYLIRHALDKPSYNWIASEMGGVHHTSVMHACAFAEDSAEYAEYLEQALRRLKEPDDA